MTAQRICVALLGFSDFERRAHLCTFRLGERDAVEVQPVHALEHADVIVADADFPEIVRQVMGAGRIDRTIFVGSDAPAQAMAWMLRPIDPQRVLRRLVELVRLNSERPSRTATF